jgi:hypothetical protein
MDESPTLQTLELYKPKPDKIQGSILKCAFFILQRSNRFVYLTY